MQCHARWSSLHSGQALNGSNTICCTRKIHEEQVRIVCAQKHQHLKCTRVLLLCL